MKEREAGGQQASLGIEPSPEHERDLVPLLASDPGARLAEIDELFRILAAHVSVWTHLARRCDESLRLCGLDAHVSWRSSNIPISGTRGAARSVCLQMTSV